MNILIKLINDVKALCNTVITAVNAIKAKTDTITADLFTATHASRIDATISSRQANAGLTTTHASRIDASISSRASQASVDAIYSKVATGLGCVKSIQRGSNAINSTTITQAISSVDINKSTINLMLKASPNQSASNIKIAAEFASSSSIIITSNYTGAYSAIWEVIEFV